LIMFLLLPSPIRPIPVTGQSGNGRGPGDVA
jgi:hypothetical protein